MVKLTYVSKSKRVADLGTLTYSCSRFTFRIFLSCFLETSAHSGKRVADLGPLTYSCSLLSEFFFLASWRLPQIQVLHSVAKVMQVTRPLPTFTT